MTTAFYQRRLTTPSSRLPSLVSHQRSTDWTCNRGLERHMSSRQLSSSPCSAIWPTSWVDMIQCELGQDIHDSSSLTYSLKWPCSQIALIIFIIGSAICTGAQSLPMLLAGRGLSGIGAAGLISVVRVVSSDSESLQENTFVNAMLVATYSAGFSTG